MREQTQCCAAIHVTPVHSYRRRGASVPNHHSPLANAKGFNSVCYDAFFINHLFSKKQFAIAHASEPGKRLSPMDWEGNPRQKQDRAPYQGTCFTSTINSPRIKILSLMISRLENCRSKDARSETDEKVHPNVNDGRRRTFQVHEDRGTSEALTCPHTVAALSVVFTLVQILLHIYRNIKERLADNETVVYSYSYKPLSRRRLLVLPPGQMKKKPKAWSQEKMVKKLTHSRYLFSWVLLAMCLVFHQSSQACTDIRDQVSEFNTCLEYDADSSTFRMACDFSWGSEDTNKCIVLHKNETFEGNGYSINLHGVTNWDGLFRIVTSDENDGPSSLDDAPVIHDVHMIGGETTGSVTGGFIIQSQQKHFIVHNCSSSGVIQGNASPDFVGGGGICGQRCSGDILITHCWSTGEIQGYRYSAGGIAGRRLGFEGETSNTVTISHCYSTGDIVGSHSGGISGRDSRNSQGMVIIKQCYSLGEIRGSGSGGITGGWTERNNGHVSILNCYSRGDITGSNHAGGICGRDTGTNAGTVILTNVYASGTIIGTNAGGLIGSISDNANEISITMSVYNGDPDDMIGGSTGNDAHQKEKNSGDIGDITGTVYCHNNDSNQCWDTDTVWQAGDEEEFPILQGMPTPLPSATPTPTPSMSSPLKETKTATPTSTSTESNTKKSACILVLGLK